MTIHKAGAVFGLAGVLAMVAMPAMAQRVLVDRYYAGPRVYVAPYSGFAYAPGYWGYRNWDGPAGYDTGGQAFSYRELGVQPGPFSGAPANPCTLGLRQQNRC